MKHLLLIAFAFVFANGLASAQTCVPKKHSSIPKIVDQNYVEARKMLMNKGWQPFQTHSYMTGKEAPDISFGNGPIFWDRGYFEVESCSGTGMASCNFLFKDVYGNRLQVGTVGEEDLVKYHASVRSFKFVCE